MSKNLSELSGRQGLENNLFDRYGQLIQDTPRPNAGDLEKLADEFLIGTSNTYGAITFYDFLKPENQGKKVYVCNGSVCTCAGTQDQLREDLKAHFKVEEIGEMCCLGRCHENHAFHYNGRNYSGKINGELANIISQASTRKDKYNVSTVGASALVDYNFVLDDFGTTLKDMLSRDATQILAEIEASGLRGRGGAGFPKAIKLRTAMAAESDIKFIICNADEGDPGAYSDRYLLEERPLMVLFGMMMAGYVIGANWGVVYIRGEYPESVDIVNETVARLRAAGLIGEKILGSDFSFEFKIIKAQGSYICGEESALINSIEGQRPEVRIRPPYPAEQGLFNKPTVVNNVETLAFAPFILREGGAAFAAIGSEGSKGTKLVCLDSQFVRPGIVEVEMGTPLKTVVYEIGGGFRAPVKALHIGGPLGGIVPVSMIDKLTVDFESFDAQGFLLGHASIVSIPEAFPIIKYLEHLFEFAADESCGKCFPCRLGTRRAQEMFYKAYHEEYKLDRKLIDDLMHTLEVGSLCAHGGGIHLPVKNVLQHFAEELRPYFAKN